MPCLFKSSYEDYCKTPFQISIRCCQSVKLYYEDRDWMISVKVMPLKVETVLIVVPNYNESDGKNLLRS